MEDEEIEINTASKKQEVMQGNDTDFTEVKLCSKNGAFLMEKHGKGKFIYYSTQNTRVKGETPKQKLQI